MFKIFLTILVVLILSVIFYVILSFVVNPFAADNQNPKMREKNLKKRNVFLDLGTNNGLSVKQFIDVPVIKKDDSYLEGYGALDGKKWEIYAVEANPYFNGMLQNLKHYCEYLGHTVNLYTETAAWIRNEKLIFYLDTVNTRYNFWGSSLLKQHPDVVSSGFKNVTVNGIDIAEILAKYSPDDEIVLKIDIEGSEYDLLLHLIKTGTLHLVDIIAVEFHHRFLSDNEFSMVDLEIFFNDYFKFFKIKTVPWY